MKSFDVESPKDRKTPSVTATSPTKKVGFEEDNKPAGNIMTATFFGRDPTALER